MKRVHGGYEQLADCLLIPRFKNVESALERDANCRFSQPFVIWITVCFVTRGARRFRLQNMSDRFRQSITDLILSYA